ncbi:MAG: hypothetical protein IV090_05015 [Candidatus Sericytochromatia bacterium]|nr:hypothetical protein [Candidatus Sericytochromatia bacterium]
MFDQTLIQALRTAEQTYDRVIRRWGNIPFAQSCVYDWVWSEEFCLLCHALSEIEKGRVRVYIMHAFGVHPWPWHRQPSPPPREY